MAHKKRKESKNSGRKRHKDKKEEIAEKEARQNSNGSEDDQPDTPGVRKRKKYFPAGTTINATSMARPRSMGFRDVMSVMVVVTAPQSSRLTPRRLKQQEGSGFVSKNRKKQL